jgi:hypothetical protein
MQTAADLAGRIRDRKSTWLPLFIAGRTCYQPLPILKGNIRVGAVQRAPRLFRI